MTDRTEPRDLVVSVAIAASTPESAPAVIDAVYAVVTFSFRIDDVRYDGELSLRLTAED